jgi:hypothetical protein
MNRISAVTVPHSLLKALGNHDLVEFCEAICDFLEDNEDAGVPLHAQLPLAAAVMGAMLAERYPTLRRRYAIADQTYQAITANMKTKRGAQ